MADEGDVDYDDMPNAVCYPATTRQCGDAPQLEIEEVNEADLKGVVSKGALEMVFTHINGELRIGHKRMRFVKAVLAVIGLVVWAACFWFLWRKTQSATEWEIAGAAAVAGTYFIISLLYANSVWGKIHEEIDEYLVGRESEKGVTLVFDVQSSDYRLVVVLPADKA